MLKNRENVGFKKGYTPWNKNKNYKLRPMTEKEYINMMNRDCKYVYTVYFNDNEIYNCLGLTKLKNFCKDSFGISRGIVDLIIRGKWTPKFEKHKILKSLKIYKKNRSVSTNSDECSCVEWGLQPFEVQGILNRMKR